MRFAIAISKRLSFPVRINAFLSFLFFWLGHHIAKPSLSPALFSWRKQRQHTHTKKRERKFQLKRDIYSRIRYIEEKVPGGVWFLSIHALHVIYFFIFSCSHQLPFLTTGPGTSPFLFLNIRILTKSCFWCFPLQWLEMRGGNFSSS